MRGEKGAAGACGKRPAAEKDEVSHREVAEAMQGMDRDGGDVCVFAEGQRTIK